MSLDNFRSDFRKIDKINQSYIEPLYAKQGDYNGRDLIVQITDGGEVKDQTGVTLNLGWKHESIGNSGLEPFSVLDVSQGMFKVSYPTELLNPGRVSGVIQIIEDGKIGHTFNVTIVVDKNPIDETAVVSDNAFTTLQDALLRVESVAAYTFQGSVATFADLPTEDLAVGDIYHVVDEGLDYAWNGAAFNDISRLAQSADEINYDNATSGLTATKVQTAIDQLTHQKVDKVDGKELSDENYTLEEKNKVANVPNDTNAQLADIDQLLSDITITEGDVY